LTKKTDVKHKNSFGEYLLDLRRKAGNKSLDEVVDLYSIEARTRGMASLSKSMLSLYERGKIDTPKPDTLVVLAKLYGVPYEALATAWFCDRYNISQKDQSLLVKQDNGQMRIPAPNGNGGVTLITIDRHRRNQAALANGSEVAVAATNFLDGEGEFFDLVSNNIKRGIKYRYLLPEEHRFEFEAFVQKLERTSALKLKLKDPDVLRFILRPALSLPMSYVLYLLPGGKIEAYLSLPEQEFPKFYLAADERLSMALYDSFRWSATLSEQYEIKRALALLQIDVEQGRKSEPKKQLRGFELGGTKA
jgi:transcriptional regulator with XRE-family HTH domain